MFQQISDYNFIKNIDEVKIIEEKKVIISEEEIKKKLCNIEKNIKKLNKEWQDLNDKEYNIIREQDKFKYILPWNNIKLEDLENKKRKVRKRQWELNDLIKREKRIKEYIEDRNCVFFLFKKREDKYYIILPFAYGVGKEEIEFKSAIESIEYKIIFILKDRDQIYQETFKTYEEAMLFIRNNFDIKLIKI